MKQIIALLHKSQQLKDIKKKSMTFSPQGRSNVIEFLIHHITKLHDSQRNREHRKLAFYTEMTHERRLSVVMVIYATWTIAILISSIIGITAYSSNVSALTYQDNIGLNFTFNPSLSVSLSSASGGSNADLIINDLTPGTSSDSNIVDINVITNNINGYYLTSTVGNSTDLSPSHNTTNLVHSNGSDTFTSLSPNDSIVDLSSYDTSSLTNPNVWGYSYSVDNQSTWSAYSGLPLYSDTGHIAILSNKYLPSNDTINFKIGAKTSISQASGEYTNTINFIATAYPHPMSLADSYAYFNKQPVGGYYTMQDMEPGICAVADENSELTVIDIRDNNTYTIAKLADGRCWMTQNLDLPGETELYSETSNVPEGYPEDGGVPYYTLPASSMEGFDDNTKAFVYNSGNHTDDCTSSQFCYSYYSWVAAVAGNRPNTVPGTNAPYDICPNNWRLPTSSLITPYMANSELYGLLYSYGMTTGGISANQNTNPTGATVYNNIKKGTLPNIVLSGQCYQGACANSGGWVHLWSSTVSSAHYQTYTASIASWTVSSANNDVQRYGFSIRCIANNY